MKKALKILFRLIVALIIVVPIGFVLMIRFADVQVTDRGEGRILFAYDHDNNKFLINEWITYELDGIDGPYIINDSLYYVDSKNVLSREPMNVDSIRIQVNNADSDVFYIHLKSEHKVPESQHSMPAKLIAISDIEGNFNAFSSFLIQNKVINADFNWIYGDGELVLVGDFVDRGDNVTQVLWLIYQLEQEAELQGGKVHFILGNHEIMNFQGRWRHARDKYKKIAQEIGGNTERKENYKLLYSNDSELGKWLRTKNVVEKIGDYLFVHAGLSPEILSFDLSLSDINKVSRENWDKGLYSNPMDDEIVNFLMGRKSPIWYRGLTMNYKYYDKIKEHELDDILKYYNSKKIVIGHTVVEDVSTDFNGKVIKIDVKHGKEKNSEKTKGLLIENNIAYKINGSEKMRTQLQNESQIQTKK